MSTVSSCCQSFVLVIDDTDICGQCDQECLSLDVCEICNDAVAVFDCEYCKEIELDYQQRKLNHEHNLLIEGRAI